MIALAFWLMLVADRHDFYVEMKQPTLDLQICFLEQPRHAYNASYLDDMIKACRPQVDAWRRAWRIADPYVDCGERVTEMIWEVIRP